MKLYQDLGIHGYWNDMNEPAIDGQAMPDNVVFDFDGQKSSALEGHNLYGMLMARASFESAQFYGGNRRPFVLSRAGFAGIQRYAAVWSGDNQAKDEHILLGVLLINQMGLSGVAFTGPDLGGYIGDGNKDLYRRWIEVDAFAPYMRSHREQLAAANDPWSYGEEVEAISKSYLQFRYQLLPYLYSAFHAAAATGLPVSRSLSIDNPFDTSVYDRSFQYEFMFGDALLLNPMTSREESKQTYLPAGQWYDLFTDQRIDGGKILQAAYPAHRIPIMVKASAIIPMQQPVQSTKDDPGPVLYVHVYNGSAANRFEYYDDDGISLNYQNGAFLHRSIDFDPQHQRLHFSRPEGTYSSPFTRIKLVMHGFDDLRGLSVNGVALVAHSETIKILDPLRLLQDVYYEKARVQRLRDDEQMRVQTAVEFDNAPEITVRWRAH